MKFSTKLFVIASCFGINVFARTPFYNFTGHYVVEDQHCHDSDWREIPCSHRVQTLTIAELGDTVSLKLGSKTVFMSEHSSSDIDYWVSAHFSGGPNFAHWIESTVWLPTDTRTDVTVTIRGPIDESFFLEVDSDAYKLRKKK